MYPLSTINVLNKNIKTTKDFPMKFSIFVSEKICCILHRQVFVMRSKTYNKIASKIIY